MTRIVGTLRYTGWTRPWLLIDGEVTQDFRPIVWRFVEDYIDKPARMADELHVFTMQGHTGADMVIAAGPRDAAYRNFMLTAPRGAFGFKNAGAYLDMALQRLNGRRLILDHSADGFSLFGDPSRDDEPEVRFIGRGTGNLCPIPASAVDDRCKPGTSDCCAFLVMGAAGFECAKFSGSLCRQILDRLAEGTIRAKRIGSCRLMGRID